jgi:hypothetical protein
MLTVQSRTKEGTPFSFYYAGVITVDEGVGKIFAFSPESKTIPFGASCKLSLHVATLGHQLTLLLATLHTFEAGAPELKDLENCHWVGNGRFIIGEGGSITVESRISKVVPSTDMD